MSMRSAWCSCRILAFSAELAIIRSTVSSRPRVRTVSGRSKTDVSMSTRFPSGFDHLIGDHQVITGERGIEAPRKSSGKEP